MRCRKVGMIPAKADPEHSTYLKAGTRTPFSGSPGRAPAVFFVDAAHFVLAPFLGFLWSSCAFIQAPAGRQRFNVLGALMRSRTNW